MLIVHGERDPETRKVQQRTLFTFYTRAEVKAALGEHEGWFRSLLEEQRPWIRFDWKRIRQGLEAALAEQGEGEGALPELYPYREVRGSARFRDALTRMVKELLVADPQLQAASAQLLRQERVALEFLRDQIQWRLDCATEDNATPGRFNRDDPFLWCRLAQRREVPPETWELLFELLNQGELERAEGVARLLIRAWERFADGHNVLGRVALARGELESAREHFERAREVGRALFPKRIRKASYWTDLDTRPFIRALVSLVGVHNRLGAYDEALALCDELERRCGMDVEAALGRAPVHLNRGDWGEAARWARSVHELYTVQSLPLALALHEQGRQADARAHLLHALLCSPRAVHRVAGLGGGRGKGKAGMPFGPPESSDEIRDHNAGVEMKQDLAAYLERRGAAVRAFVGEALQNPGLCRLVAEAQEVRQRWAADRSGDRTGFERKQEMESMDFARTQVAGLWPVAG